MFKLFTTLACLSTLLFSSQWETSNVENKYFKKIDIPIKNNIEQNIHFGFLYTTGNTQSLNLNGEYDIAMLQEGYKGKDLRYIFSSSVYLSEIDKTKSNEEYQASMGIEQSLANDWSAYVSADWYRNPEFRNLDNKASFNIGVGNDVFKNETQNIKIKLGLAYNIEDYTNTQKIKQFRSINEYIEYTNTINNHSRFVMKLGSLQNVLHFSSDYEILGVVSLEVKITKSLHIKLSEELMFDSLPSVGLERTDSKTLISIGYNF